MCVCVSNATGKKQFFCAMFCKTMLFLKVSFSVCKSCVLYFMVILLGVCQFCTSAAVQTQVAQPFSQTCSCGLSNFKLGKVVCCYSMIALINLKNRMLKDLVFHLLVLTMQSSPMSGDMSVPPLLINQPDIMTICQDNESFRL